MPTLSLSCSSTAFRSIGPCWSVVGDRWQIAATMIEYNCQHCLPPLFKSTAIALGFFHGGWLSGQRRNTYFSLNINNLVMVPRHLIPVFHLAGRWDRAKSICCATNSIGWSRCCMAYFGEKLKDILSLLKSSLAYLVNNIISLKETASKMRLLS